MPRLAGVLAASGVVAAHRLFIAEGLVRGDPGEGLAFLTLLIAGPLYAACTLIVAVITALSPADRARRSTRIGLGLALPAVAACAGVFSLHGPGPRLTLGAAAAISAFVVERGFGCFAGSRGRFDAALASIAAIALVLGVPLLSILVPDDAYRMNLASAEPERVRNVVIVGVDGVDWGLFARYRDAGELPNLTAIASEGVLSPLRTLTPTSSPFIWNSIYTGFSPSVHDRRPPALAAHGDLLYRSPMRRKLPDLPDALLRAMGSRPVRHPFALWDILAGAGWEAAVVGAWERLPVPRTHAVYTSTSHHYQARWPASRHLLMASRHAWIAPSHFERLRSLELAPRDVPEEEWRAVFGDRLSRREIVEAPYAGQTTPRLQRIARTRAVYASDRLRVAMATDLMRSLPQPFALFLYIRGIDVVQHCYLHQLRGDIAEDERDMGDMILRYHRIVDTWIGEVRERLNPDDVLIVLSDHGFNVDEQRSHPYKTGFHDFAPDGVLISNVRSGPSPNGSGAHVLDVTPTVLAALGLPVLASMEGRILTEITPRTSSVTDWRTLTPVIYERGDPEDVDPELLDLLRSLGYL